MKDLCWWNWWKSISLSLSLPLALVMSSTHRRWVAVRVTCARCVDELSAHRALSDVTSSFTQTTDSPTVRCVELALPTPRTSTGLQPKHPSTVLKIDFKSQTSFIYKLPTPLQYMVILRLNRISVEYIEVYRTRFWFTKKIKIAFESNWKWIANRIDSLSLVSPVY